MTLSLLTTDAELKTLADLEDAARDTSETIRVPRAALNHLLRDHYTLYGIATAPASRGGKATPIATITD